MQKNITRHLVPILILVFILLISSVFAATISPIDRTITGTTIFMDWSNTNLNDPEEIDVLRWPNPTNGPNLTNSFIVTDPNGARGGEYFGNSGAYTSQGQEVSLVGAGNTGTWEQSADNQITIRSRTSGFSNSAGIPVETRYTFADEEPAANIIHVERSFELGSTSLGGIRPYVPRLHPIDTYRRVLYPTPAGVLADVDARLCSNGCIISRDSSARSDLPFWNGSSGWYAIHNPSNATGLIVRRQPSTATAHLWIDWDGTTLGGYGSYTNASSFYLTQSGGFQGTLTESQLLCFYDSTTWSQTMRNQLQLPASCQRDTLSTTDLSITQSASPNPAYMGTNLSYSLVVTNNGPAAATGVVLTDTLPSNVTYSSAIPNENCDQAGNTVTCIIGTLDSGSSTAITIVVKPKAPGTSINTATVSGMEHDPNTINNTARAMTEIITDTIIPGGTWISPAPKFVVTENHLHFAAHAFDNRGGSGIKEVRFSFYYADGNRDVINPSVWGVACIANTPNPGTDIYECAWPIAGALNGAPNAGVPNGKIKVSFDVYDNAGNSNLSPNGTKSGTIKKGWGIAFDYPIGERDKAGRRQPTGWDIQQDFNGTTRVGADPDQFHAGEDWQVVVNRSRSGAATIGKAVYAIAPGKLVHIHATQTYPGSAIILKHETPRGILYSVYAHISVSTALKEAWQRGEQVYIEDTNTAIGTVVEWPGDPLNSHLHFETRTFLTDPDVTERAQPPFICGCTVGPGYWLWSLGGPAAKGWLDPNKIIDDSRRSQ